MEHNVEILNKIIHQNIERFKGYRLEPAWITIRDNPKQISRLEILGEVSHVGSLDYQEVSEAIQLNNEIWILTSCEIDIPINATLTLESLDNLFIINKAEYTIINYYKYQAFSNYLKISLKDYGTYVPFQLEFLRIIPII